MMALRNRCCTEEEAQHKHDFDWLLEAATKVTIYTIVQHNYISQLNMQWKNRQERRNLVETHY